MRSWVRLAADEWPPFRRGVGTGRHISGGGWDDDRLLVPESVPRADVREPPGAILPTRSFG